MLTSLLRLTAIAMLALMTPALPAQDAAPADEQQEPQRKRVFFLTKSTGFQHSVIARRHDEQRLAHAERILVDLGREHGFDVFVTKDASLLNDPATLEAYDVFAFYTTGDLTRDSRDGGGNMTPEGTEAFLRAIENGKGFIGFHSATDTFHSPRPRGELLRDAEGRPQDIRDPYIAMIGGEFAGHGAQQRATQRVASPNFPGLEGLEDFELHEEWYNMHNIADDLHVILVQDTATMFRNGQRERHYNRPPYPATWARMHGEGRVFYTSMGHREDVWTNPTFQKIILAGLNWTARNTDFDAKPNIDEATPQWRGE